MASNIFFTFNYQNWPLAATFEIILDQIESGESVTWVDLTGRITPSHGFPLADRAHYRILRHKMRKFRLLEGLGALSKDRFKVFVASMSKEFVDDRKTHDLASQVAYLELIAMVREAEPSRSEFRFKLNQYTNTFLKTYSTALEILKSTEVDKVYLYNGRFLQERAVWEACNYLGIEVVFFEKFHPNWTDRYFLFEKPTHSPAYRSLIMKEFGDRLRGIDHSLFLKKGSQWFEDRINGKTQEFTSRQTNFSNFQLDKPLLVFFHSSEDELITTDLVSKTWGNQIDALKTLVKVLGALNSHALIVRAHPNLLYKSQKEIDLWRKLGRDLEVDYDWVRFIDSESDINSYQLVRDSEVVVTVGSTIGVEAAYLRKKSILIGRAFHEDMDITVNPMNSSELASIIMQDFSNEELEYRHLNSLNYAIFNELGGEIFSNLQRLELGQKTFFTFNGLVIKQSLFVSILMRVDTLIRKVIPIWR